MRVIPKDTAYEPFWSEDGYRERVEIISILPSTGVWGCGGDGILKVRSVHRSWVGTILSQNEYGLKTWATYNPSLLSGIRSLKEPRLAKVYLHRLA